MAGQVGAIGPQRIVKGTSIPRTGSTAASLGVVKEWGPKTGDLNKNNSPKMGG